MAVRNTSLGGTDWVANEKLLSADLNDTFDDVAGKLHPLLTITEDATHITVSYNSTALFRIVKSTGNLQIVGGFDSDTVI